MSANGFADSWNQARMLRIAALPTCSLMLLVGCLAEAPDHAADVSEDGGDPRELLFELPVEPIYCGDERNEVCCLDNAETRLSCAPKDGHDRQCVIFGSGPFESARDAQDHSTCVDCGEVGAGGAGLCCSGGLEVVNGEFTGIPTCVGDGVSCSGPAEPNGLHPEDWTCHACGDAGEPCPTCGEAGQPPCPGDSCGIGGVPTPQCSGETTCEPVDCGGQGQPCCTQPGVADCRLDPNDCGGGPNEICYGKCDQFGACGKECSCGEIGEPPCVGTGCAPGLVDHAQELCGTGQALPIHTCELESCGGIGQQCCGTSCWATSCARIGGKWRVIAAECSNGMCE